MSGVSGEIQTPQYPLSFVSYDERITPICYRVLVERGFLISAEFKDFQMTESDRCNPNLEVSHFIYLFLK